MTMANLCADSIRVVHPLFQEEGDGATPISALNLFVATMPTGLAALLNRLWHSRLPRLGNWFQCSAFGASYANRYYAVALWSHPVARHLNGKGLLELRRLAIADDAPKNTASFMLGVMRRSIRREMPWVKGLVSYQDTEVHKGTIYKAAGWREIPKNDKRSRPWNHCGRPRNNEQSKAEKVRWQIDT